MTQTATNIQSLPNIDLIFQDIERLREIKQSIAAFEAEKKLIETNLKTTYFAEKEIFEFHGRILATCKDETRNILDSQSLKTDLPEVYENYLKPSTSKVLRLK